MAGIPVEPPPGWTVEVKDTTSSTTTTTTPNRAPFQRQFIVIADVLFTTELPEDSLYPVRRISEHLGWSSKEWSFLLPSYRASFKGRQLAWEPGLPGPNGSLHTLQDENIVHWQLYHIMPAERWGKVSEQICIGSFEWYSIRIILVDVFLKKLEYEEQRFLNKNNEYFQKTQRWNVYAFWKSLTVHADLSPTAICEAGESGKDFTLGTC